MGWRGEARHWHRYEQLYYLMAALATPLVVSVHSIVSADFAVAIVPGWHSTIFPPYFVAGAIYSGFGMVLTIAIPLRAIYRLHDLVTLRHIDAMAKIHAGERHRGDVFLSHGDVRRLVQRQYLSSSPALLNRAFGPYAPWYWTLIFCNVVVAQSLWFKRVRTSLPLLFVVSLLINFGMWVERFVIVITSLHRDYMPSAWGLYYPTVWDLATLFGTLGLFVALMFLFIRLLPMIPAFEVRRMIAEEPSRGRRG